MEWLLRPGLEILAINLIAENQPFDSTWHENFRCNRHGQVMADWVSSPMAASEQSSSQNLDLADWPVWRKLIDRSGSNTDRCLPPDGISCLVRSPAKRSEKPFTAVGRAAPHLRAGPDF